MYKLRLSVIAPTFFLELRDIADFVNEFGPYNGQYAALHPNDWFSLFLEHIKELTPIQQKAAECYREQVKHSLIDAGRPYDSNISWAENASAIAIGAPDKCQHFVGDAIDPAPFKGWKDVLEKIRDSRERSFPIKGRLPEFLELFKPLLLNATNAYIVDPFFSPLGLDEEQIIRRIFDKIKGAKCYHVHIITRDFTLEKKDKRFIAFNELEEKFALAYRELIPAERKLHLHLVDDIKNDGKHLRLHDRFFLTRFGAIQFGAGIKLFNNTIPQLNVAIVDKSHHEQLKHTYIDGVSRFAESLPRKPDVAYPRAVRTITLSS